MFTQINAASAMASSTAAPPVSVRRNVRSGVCMFRAHAVRPENERAAAGGPWSVTALSSPPAATSPNPGTDPTAAASPHQPPASRKDRANGSLARSCPPAVHGSVKSPAFHAGASGAGPLDGQQLPSGKLTPIIRKATQIAYGPAGYHEIA